MDESNTNEVSKGSMGLVTLEDTVFPLDENKIMRFNFNEDYAKVNIP